MAVAHLVLVRRNALVPQNIPSHQWGGYIAPILEDIISHDGITAVRTAAFLVSRSDHGIAGTWSRDSSLATIPDDPNILAHCYIKDVEDYGTLTALEAAFARGETKEIQRHVSVDFLAQCIARRLEEIVYGRCYPNA